MKLVEQNSKQAIRNSAYTAVCACALLLSITFLTGPVTAQDNGATIKVQPMGNWIERRQATYGSSPILIHLRTGYERAILMPEPVRLQDADASLPGCDITIDDELIGFYPTTSFYRQPVLFVGQVSGDVYELRIRASTAGLRQPLQINR